MEFLSQYWAYSVAVQYLSWSSKTLCLSVHNGLCFSAGEMSEPSTSHPQAIPCPCTVNGQLYSFILPFTSFFPSPKCLLTAGGLCHSLKIFMNLPLLFSLCFPFLANRTVKCTGLCIVTCMIELCLLSYECLAKCPPPFLLMLTLSLDMYIESSCHSDLLITYCTTSI